MTARVLVTALLLPVLVGCETRLPLAYLRESVRPETVMAATERLTDEGDAGLAHDLPAPVALEWPDIVQRDTLRALLTFNSTGYFIHKGEPLGYDYELLHAFAEEHELALETVVVRDRLLLFRMLNGGEGDVVAARLVAVPGYLNAVALTRPLYTTAPVVVQRIPEALPTDGAEGGRGGTDAGETDPTATESIQSQMLHWECAV